LPFLGNSLTTANFVSFNFESILHVNHDDGNAFAIAYVVEVHHKGCKNASTDQSCCLGWVFFVPTLGFYISLHHGTTFAWDSENLPHGSSFDGYDPEGCQSKGYVFVSQIKRSHQMRALRI
jgi:hypothetical protein